MRADARRNSERLRQTAAELFAERGIMVPLKEIAREAGVSHGTLYNLFGSRETLVDAVIGDIVVDCFDQVADEALACGDAWGGVVRYVMSVCELQVSHPAIADVVTGALPSSGRLMQICQQALDAAQPIMERARDEGTLRKDVADDDLRHLFVACGAISKAGPPTEWRRHAGFVLDGFRNH